MANYTTLADRLPTTAAQFFYRLRRTGGIIGAVLLQDMRTRFGRSYAGYLIAVAWPLSHMGFIIVGYLLTTKIAPVGDDPAVFLATGLLPYILCFYPARMMALTIFQNRQLLNIPILKPIHLIIARSILETLTAVAVCILFYTALFIFDVDFMPVDIIEAAAAIAASIYFGVGLGILNVVLCALFGPFFLVFFIVILIGAYLVSGVYIPIWVVPEPTRSYMLYNPLLHLVEWLRSAYYTSYGAETIDKGLVLGVATVALALGLLGERFLRGKFFV